MATGDDRQNTSSVLVFNMSFKNFKSQKFLQKANLRAPYQPTNRPHRYERRIYFIR